MFTNTSQQYFINTETMHFKKRTQQNASTSALP